MLGGFGLSKFPGSLLKTQEIKNPIKEEDSD